MTWTPTATRAHVVRMLARWADKSFSPRSAMGAFSVHESRSEADDRPLCEYSEVEKREAFRNAILSITVERRASRRTDIGRRHCVAPRGTLAPIVRTRTTRSSGPAGGMRNWRANVGKVLQQLSTAERDAVTIVALLRPEITERQNRLDAHDRAARRLASSTSTGKSARTKRREAELRRTAAGVLARTQRENVEALRDECRRMEAESEKQAKSAAYDSGIERLLTVCTETEEIERYLLLGEWM